MGRFDAALAVLVLDRNRSHPVNPVRSPGGALRAMTDRARSGDLNIDASIFAILRRSDIDADRPN
jgi:replication initiation protein RepC